MYPTFPIATMHAILTPFIILPMLQCIFIKVNKPKSYNKIMESILIFGILISLLFLKPRITKQSTEFT